MSNSEELFNDSDEDLMNYLLERIYENLSDDQGNKDYKAEIMASLKKTINLAKKFSCKENPQTNLAEYEEKDEAIEAKLENLEIENEKLEKALKEEQNLNNKKTNETQELNNKITKLNDSLNKSKLKHEKDKNDTLSKHAKEMKDLESKHYQDKKDAKSKYGKEINDLKCKHEKDKNDTLSKHTKQVEDLQRKPYCVKTDTVSGGTQNIIFNPKHTYEEENRELTDKLSKSKLEKEKLEKKLLDNEESISKLQNELNQKSTAYDELTRLHKELQDKYDQERIAPESQY